MPRTAPTAPRTVRGVTLVESLITLSVVAVTAGAALPGWETARERRHLEGAAAQLVTDLALTRSLAVARGEELRVRFRSDASGSCYVVHSGSADACTCSGAGTATCSGEASTFRSAHFAAGGPVTVQSNVGSMGFHPALGTITPTGTMRVVARSGATLHGVINIMGRVRTCTPTGVPGYRAC